MLEPKHPISVRARRRCFQGLVRICGEYGILPTSYMVPESKIQKLGDSSISSGGFSDVWLGGYEEKSVAIKVMRCKNSRSLQKIKKVRAVDLPLSQPSLIMVQDFCREAVVWKHLSHPNILPFIGVTTNDERDALISPWMRNGTIIKYLRNNQVNPLKLARSTTPYPMHF